MTDALLFNFIVALPNVLLQQTVLFVVLTHFYSLAILANISMYTEPKAGYKKCSNVMKAGIKCLVRFVILFNYSFATFRLYFMKAKLLKC